VSDEYISHFLLVYEEHAKHALVVLSQVHYVDVPQAVYPGEAVVYFVPTGNW
jgi:hypothetical protein